MLLIAIGFIVWGAFPAPVKMGLLIGVWTAISVFLTRGEYFGVRPGRELNSALLAGLVALESARLEAWQRSKLFGGAALLTWAATLQYYAIPAALGIVIYGAAAWWDLGWRRARWPVIASLRVRCCRRFRRSLSGPFLISIRSRDRFMRKDGTQQVPGQSRSICKSAAHSSNLDFGRSGSGCRSPRESP